MSPPTCHEVKEVMKKLKPIKAAGSDSIPTELIKQGGIGLKRKIHKLIEKVWKEEILPTEWTEGINCLIYRVFHDFRA